MKVIKKAVSLIILSGMFMIITGCSFESKTELMQREIISDWTNSGTYEETSFMKCFDSASSFEVIAVEKEGKDCYVVKCNVTSPDLLEALKKSKTKIPFGAGEDELNEIIIKLVENSKPKTTSQNVSVFKTDDGYHVEYTEGFVDAMYGYSYLYCREQMDNLLKDLYE